MDDIITVKNLVNRFGTHIVHDGLDMSLRKNEILGVVGGSGSGKSVLLRSILGLHKPTSGSITISGQAIEDIDAQEWIELQKKIGIVFQNGALYSGLSTLDNIAFPLREHTDIDEKTIRELSLLKLYMVGLKPEDAEKFPSELSGGMARRVALARALALDPEVLFLDEPTTGLDPISAAAFDEMILSLRDALDLSVFIITHDLDTLVNVCDRIAIIVDKKITTGTLDDMMQSGHEWIKSYFHGPRMRAIPQHKKG